VRVARKRERVKGAREGGARGRRSERAAGSGGHSKGGAEG
jgi:hypothetical protein